MKKIPEDPLTLVKIYDPQAINGGILRINMRVKSKTAYRKAKICIICQQAEEN